MSQIHDGIAGGSFVEDGTAGSYIMDLVPLDIPPVVPETVPSQVASITGQDQAPAIWPGNIMWGSPFFIQTLPADMAVIIPVTKPFRPALMNNSAFSLWNLSVSAHIEVVTYSTYVFSMSRQWNGIGGFQYVPSFPQLDRKATSWPHAT